MGKLFSREKSLEVSNNRIHEEVCSVMSLYLYIN